MIQRFENRYPQLIFLYSFFSFFFTILFLAQVSESSMSLTHLSLEHGLSQTKIKCILQDSDGFMWFGTENGLNKYDGYKIKIYQNDVENPNSLNHNIISALHEDKQGLLWIGTEGGGINVLDRQTGQFVHYMHNPENPGSLTSNSILCIYEDRSGILWFGTWGGGLNRFDRKTKQFAAYRADKKDFSSISHNIVSVIHEDSNGDFWVGTVGGGLNRFNPKTGQFKHYRHEPDNSNSLSDDVVSSIIEDKSGKLWIGTWGGGLNSFDPKKNEFQVYTYVPDNLFSWSYDDIWPIFEHCAGWLLIGTSQGLNQLDRNTGQFHRYYYSPDDPEGLSDSEILSIYEDRAGVLWIGTAGGGLTIYHSSVKNFNHYKPEPHKKESLNHPEVTAIYEYKPGLLLVGTGGGGLNVFDSNIDSVTHYKPESAQLNSLSHFDVMSIYEDSFGLLWLGTGNGLNRYDHDSGQFFHYNHKTMDPTSLSSGWIQTICQDQFGSLWIGTDKDGLNKLIPSTNKGEFYQDKILHYRHNPKDPKSLSNNEITSIIRDKSGTLWIGTFGGGVNMLLPKFQKDEKAEFVHYRNNPDNTNSLSHDIVLSIYEDKSNTLWFGTGQGLDKFDRANNTFTHYGEKDGLPNSSVIGILEDNDGFLWLSTLHGLSQFNPETKKNKNYFADDGLQSNEFKRGSAWKNKNGHLAFGGINGFNVFLPSRIKDNPYIPPVVLTGITQDRKSILGEKSPERIEKIELDWRHNFFEFEFAALNYTYPEKNQYAYKLDGFDKEWNYIQNRRFGQYTNLPGGNYTLRLKGSNNDGIWNEQGIDIHVSVQNPPWKRWWAYCLYLYFIGGSIFARIRFDKKRRQMGRSIRLIMEGLASTTGDEFFRSLAQNIASVLKMPFVLVAENTDSSNTKASTLAFWADSDFSENFEFDIEPPLYTPENNAQACCHPRNVQKRFPYDEILTSVEAESYLRVPLLSLSGEVTGYIIVMDTKPLKNKRDTIEVLNVFANRAAAELETQLADQALNASLLEKETLLKEIHHRVKNNLQVISSLLGMQSRLIKNFPLVTTMFKESQNRIKSMALIHEKLYRSDNLSHIDFGQYVEHLGDHLLTSYGIDTEVINLNIHIKSLFLDIDTAIPCGIIVNELISNALKHAFPKGQSGTIDISLYRQEQEFTLVVRDNGIGIPEGLDLEDIDIESLGIKLVYLFTDQLDATLELQRDNGTKFTIVFSM